MPTYNVTLARAYKVQINAPDENTACRLTEFFIGDPKDGSNLNERNKHCFEIEDIEMIENDAIDVEENE